MTSASAKLSAADVWQLSAPPAPGSPYGLPVPGSERAGRSAVYRHHRFRDTSLLTTFDPDLRSMHHVFESTVARRPNKPCLGSRPWLSSTKTWADHFDWLTYADVAQRRRHFGAGLVDIHHGAGYPKDKYGSLYTVSLYETLGPDATEYIINHAELACVVCSLPHVPVLLQLAPRLPTLKLIVSLDPLDHGELDTHTKAAIFNQMASQHGIRVYSMQQVEDLGASCGRPMRPADWDDISTINYTSGTTGPPKGVVLTHGNAVSANSGSRLSCNISANDVHLSYLPLAHIYGRLVDQAALAEGAALGFFRGDILGLVDDMKILQPTGFISVPRLFNRFNSAIRAATLEADGIRGALSRHVINTKKANMRLPPGKASNKHFLYDRIWTPKVKAAVGLSRVHSMVSGSAQLDPDVQEFLRAAFGTNFSQGWGMTETYAVGSLQMNQDYSLANVGGPMGCIALSPTDGPPADPPAPDRALASQRKASEEETKKSLDPDGWFHTGDIAEVDSLGRFKIIDRKKNVLKLSQGEYISPERIENVFAGSTNLVAMAYVHGDSKESSLVAIFGVDPENFPPFASKVLNAEVPAGDVEALRKAAANPAVKKAFLKMLDDIGRRHKFNSYEKIRNVHLDVEPFTIENELLTPTLKLKRPQAAKAFRAHIDRMYEEVKAEKPARAAKL
ncbi:long-chain-fatty-acid--CoA ligase FAA2 [Ophiocordyceps sinensis CO18]|uniref:Long-chain-fatty-acid--CoA ligase FAA2 n=1 Tax=Ophiocordyceps sinensis (strain Co18 / CGMCC 3.14243) TaxID=911162 RepID=T5A643_OPHSC|nr:long-chain-fatty-acid--CoA ligase FAA2 [Ophiocordyceps sinensis CO18]